jgi:hypothetical protein
MIPGPSMPVEPVGWLAANGWMPGIFVKIVNAPLTFSGAITTVDRSDGTGMISGFLKTGPQHNQPMTQLSDMWRDDEQRPGGDIFADWTAFDAGAALQFDNVPQLQRMGSRIVSMFFGLNGMNLFYTFETLNLAERTTPGTGAPLVYVPGSKLYVSNNGYLTSEQETVGNLWTGYAVFRTGTDQFGKFLIIGEVIVG